MDWRNPWKPSRNPAPGWRNDRGRRAERRARRFLRRHGLRRVDENFHARRGEIDLVMLDGETLVFVEVRYRGGGSHVSGLESVDARKRARLVHAAGAFLARHPEHAERPCRFDIVALGDPPAEPEWFADAFRPA